MRKLRAGERSLLLHLQSRPTKRLDTGSADILEDFPMRCVTWCALAGLLVLGLSASRADANGIPFPGRQPPPPKPVPPAAVAPLVVVADENVKEPRLEIPRKLLRSLRADLGDEQEPDTRRVEAPLPRLHTILAGGALSLALVTGGLWLTRSRNRLAGRGLVLLLVAGGLLVLGSGVLWADLAPRPNPFGPKPVPNPFPNPKPPVMPVLPAGVTLADKVGIVIVEKGDAITLVVNRDDLAKVVEKTAPDNKDPKPVQPLPPRPFPRPGLPPG
jgi:hypothetical protein